MNHGTEPDYTGAMAGALIALELLLEIATLRLDEARARIAASALVASGLDSPPTQAITGLSFDAVVHSILAEHTTRGVVCRCRLGSKSVDAATR